MKTWILAALFFSSGLSVAFSQGNDTTTWTVLLGGDASGHLKKWKNTDGGFTEVFQYNDRGRGDSTISVYRYNTRGYLVDIDASGVDYFKKPVYEKFRVENGVAYWENDAEKGERTLDRDADYIPLKISTGTSFQTYFNAPDSSIDLLPSGKSRLRVHREYKLDGGQVLRLVSTAGNSLTPTFAWIDSDNQLFAYPSDWLAFVRAGYENANMELYAIQQEVEEKFFRDLVSTCTEQIRSNGSIGLAIVNATVFDPKTGKKTPHATIRIADGKIVRVSANEKSVPVGYKIIDAQGRFVMPGLWDMHVHYTGPTDGIMYLGCGVTNVRDMGNAETIINKKKEIDDGHMLGPRIQVLSGFIDGDDEFAGPVGEKIKTVDEGKIAIKKYFDAGYQQIKLYSSIKPEWVKPLADEAKRYKLRVCGHVPAHMLASEALYSGYDEIQHVNMVFLNFYGRELDTRTPIRFSAVGEKAASFDFHSSEFKTLLKQLKKQQTVIDPTVTIFEQMFTGQEGEISPICASVAQRFPLSLQRSLKSSGSLSIPTGMEDTYRASYNNILKMVKVLFDNGITLVPGSDGFAGFTLHRELENYVKAGIPNTEVLKIATITSAEVAQKDKLYGSIEQGKIADILIIDGDPTERIEDIRKVEIVVQGNSIYRTKQLLEQISIGYFK
ncbi:MAG: amidohydrolase family protein [Bacteroidota bacterium]